MPTNFKNSRIATRPVIEHVEISTNSSILTTYAFWIALLFALLGPMLLPYRLFYFSPYLVICFYKLPRISVLWRSFLCGIIFDLLSSSQTFGLTSLNYCCASWLLFGQTRNFFEDKLSTLPLMTVLFSFVSTLLGIIFLFFLGQSLPLTSKWVGTDLIGMSLLDGVYAFVIFALPFQLTQKVRKIVLHLKLRLRR